MILCWWTFREQTHDGSVWTSSCSWENSFLSIDYGNTHLKKKKRFWCSFELMDCCSRATSRVSSCILEKSTPARTFWATLWEGLAVFRVSVSSLIFGAAANLGSAVSWPGAELVLCGTAVKATCSGLSDSRTPSDNLLEGRNRGLRWQLEVDGG